MTLFLHGQGNSKRLWLCEVATQGVWPDRKFGIDAVAVPSALGTSMWEGWYDMVLKTGHGESLTGFKLTAITASQASIRSQSGHGLSGLLRISGSKIVSSICVGSPNCTFAYINSSENVLVLCSVLRWACVETRNTKYHDNVSSAD